MTYLKPRAAVGGFMIPGNMHLALSAVFIIYESLLTVDLASIKSPQCKTRFSIDSRDFGDWRLNAEQMRNVNLRGAVLAEGDDHSAQTEKRRRDHLLKALGSCSKSG